MKNLILIFDSNCMFFIATFVFAMANAVKGQTTFEVLKKRGNILYEGNKMVVEHSKLTLEQPFYFTSTSDVLFLVATSDETEGYFAKPKNFVINPKNGVKINNKTTLKESIGGGYIPPTYKMHKTMHIRNLKCLNLDSYKLATSHLSGVIIDTIWENYEIIIKPNFRLPGNNILPGDYIESTNLSHKLYYDLNGNLKLIGEKNKILWQTYIDAPTSDSCVMAEKGNLVIYAPGRYVPWSSLSCTWSDCECSYLVLANDGNLQIIDPNGQVKWQTRTWGGTVNSNTLGHIVKRPNIIFNLMKEYSIQNLENGQILGANMLSETRGQPILYSIVSNSKKLRWSFSPILNQPYYHIKTGDINYLGWTSPQLQITLYKGIANQIWDIIPTEETGILYIRNTSTGYYLEIQNNYVQLAPFTGSKNQMWKIEPIK